MPLRSIAHKKYQMKDVDSNKLDFKYITKNI